MSDQRDAHVLRQAILDHGAGKWPEVLPVLRGLMESPDAEVAARASAEVARHLSSVGRDDEAIAIVDRAEAVLAGVEAPLTRALLLVLRCSVLEHVPQEALPDLRRAGDRLTSEGLCEDAGNAYGLVAAEAARLGDLGLASACYASAIGNLEIAGSQCSGPSRLLSFAKHAIAAGDARGAKTHVEHAASRLSNVLLQYARVLESECFETLGDAHRASGQSGEARRAYEQAMAMRIRMDNHKAAEKILKKMAELATKPPSWSPEKPGAAGQPALEEARALIKEAARAPRLALSDPDAWKKMARGLTGCAQYTNAAEAHALLSLGTARVGDRAMARIACAEAVGNAELASDAVLGPAVAIAQARFELRWGEHLLASKALAVVLVRLEPIETREARVLRADALGLMGDVFRAKGSRENARRLYEQAAEAQSALGEENVAGALRRQATEL